MSDVGKPERVTQERVIRLFRDELRYDYLGDYTDRPDNSNVEPDLLGAWLKKRGVPAPEIAVAIHKLYTEANHPGRSLYDNNKAVYSLLRYGVDAKTAVGKNTEKVDLIDWEHPEQNDFAVAEEVTLRGRHDRRPDLVLYVNGIAIGVIELKSSRKSMAEGIRQCLSNQSEMFHEWFFSTVQFLFAGNDSEGLQYGTIKTEEKYFLRWKENEADNSGYKLDKYLRKMCEKERLLELMHDFVLFDAGIKKLPRVHQYFGIKAAQQHVREKRGGIIWHTQGSGKSILMVLLAKWILENNPKARVAVITDRDELDKQIEQIFLDSGEKIARTKNGRELMRQLGESRPRLICSLIQKFGPRGTKKTDEQFEELIRELESSPTRTMGELFVFVDECHRTQSGRLHRVMKAMMPNAVFIGFTGTPLLRDDAKTSREVFGGYIHTYKFSEAVEDGVILDLIYEARDIDQHLGSPMKIDAWFDAKTRGLNEWQKDELRKKWGTMQRVLSSKSRMERVKTDIIFDFSTKPRLSNQRGNAMLVASSIYEACKYFALFQQTEFRGKCALITSYDPQTKDIKTEETGANSETDKQFIFTTYTELLKDVQPEPGMTRTETYEERAKELFIKQPANMKLLIVVDKLLTGFDAPPCTYLYIDKSMQDHGLFQAICRTNRLDGEDKEFGYVVDYKDLFRKVENAIAVYTSELDHSAPGPDPEVLLKDRLQVARERLENALETLALICEPVEPPRRELEHIHYFCGNTEIAADLEERAPFRAELYKATASLVRAFANISADLSAAGYSDPEVAHIRAKADHYVKLREVIRLASGEVLDLKAYEADMRHLIDTYIEASEPRTISPFGDMSLIDLIVKSGIAEAINAQLGGMKGNRDAIAETIENNVRRKIIKEHLADPAFYESMSDLLDEVIKLRKANAISYEEYLKRVADVATRLEAGYAADTPVELRDSPALRALYSNLRTRPAAVTGESSEDPHLRLALRIDEAVRRVRADDWRGHLARERSIQRALYEVLHDEAEVERIFSLIKSHAEY